MFLVSTRPRSAIIALIVVALSACVDKSSPTEVHAQRELISAPGDVIFVTNNSGANVPGSLAQVLSQTSGGEIVRFDPSLAGAKIVLDTTLEVPNNVTIEGSADKGLTLSGAHKAGVMHVHQGATLVNLTITEGNAEVSGGGILAEGTLLLDHTTVAGNEAGSNAGILGDGITLINSTVTNNTAKAALSPGVSGGIAFNFGGGVTLIHSLVSFNSPSGIATLSAPINTKTVKFLNSIVSNNGTNCVDLIGVSFLGRNIVDDKTCGGSDLEVIFSDPLLGPLADNGGPTPTRALERTSPAINATNCGGGVTVDQRNVLRDAQCDIGPFEFVFTTIALTINPNAPVDSKTGAAIVTGTVSCSRDETFDLGVQVTENLLGKRTPSIITASRIIPVVCATTAQPWTVTITPPSGQQFDSGTALAKAATLNIAAGVTPATTLTDITLTRTKAK